MIYEYGNDAAGLHFTITTGVNATTGLADFTVNVLTGSMNLNAVYWSNGDKTDQDLTGTDLIGFTGAKSENSLNMNGSNVVWNDDGSSTAAKEIYDGGIKLSDAGLGKTLPATYLTAGSEYHFSADVDLAGLTTLGVRATSTSTADGSIKWVDEHGTEPPPVCAPHLGDSLFFEGFDGWTKEGTPILDNGVEVARVVDLGAHGWTGASHTEVGAEGYGGILDTSLADNAAGAFWLDTQNSPGGINISHTFTDMTEGVSNALYPWLVPVTSVLSFDIGTQSLDFNGQHYETDSQAFLQVFIDGVNVVAFHANEFVGNENVMRHVEINIPSEVYSTAGTHTLSIVDASANAGYTGFAIDSIQIHDWVMC